MLVLMYHGHQGLLLKCRREGISRQKGTTISSMEPMEVEIIGSVVVTL